MQVEIMSREMLAAFSKKPFPEDTAVISITDWDDADVQLDNQPKRILRLKFDDEGDELLEEYLTSKSGVAEMKQIAARFHMVSDEQISQLADFILDSPQIQTLICQCEYGQSRSAAVAAAIVEYYDRRGICIFADARYYPNKYVFRKLLHELQMRGGCGDD